MAIKSRITKKIIFNNKVFTNILYLILFVFFAKNYAYCQIDDFKRGLDVHLLIDCSRSVWSASDLTFLNDHKQFLLEQIISETNEHWKNSSDRIAISIFADNFEQIIDLEFVGHKEATKQNLINIIENIADGTQPEIKLLDINRTDIVNALKQQLEIIKAKHKKNYPLLRNEVLILITDGINDPKNESIRCINELIDKEKINYILSDLKNIHNIRSVLFQLPLKRHKSDSLVYIFNEEWTEILDSSRCTYKSSSLLKDITGVYFRKLRLLKKIGMFVTSNGFKINRFNELVGTLFLQIPYNEIQKLHPLTKIEILVKLDKIFIDDNYKCNIQEYLNEKDQKSLTWEASLEFNTLTEVTISARLPKEINLPSSGAGKLNFIFMPNTREMANRFCISPNYQCEELINYISFKR